MCVVCFRVMSAKSDASQLVRMMPLAVLIPTINALTLVLPPSGLTEKDHKPFTNAVTIARMRDRIDVMTSLMKPKKVWTFNLLLAPPKDSAMTKMMLQ